MLVKSTAAVGILEMRIVCRSITRSKKEKERNKSLSKLTTIGDYNNWIDLTQLDKFSEVKRG